VSGGSRLQDKAAPAGGGRSRHLEPGSQALVAGPAAGHRDPGTERGRPGEFPRVEVRAGSFPLSGLLVLLLVFPVFVLFGLLVLLALVVVGGLGALLAPWAARRVLRGIDAEVTEMEHGEDVVELARSSYERVGVAADDRQSGER
jgi:hypothetical protein